MLWPCAAAGGSGAEGRRGRWDLATALPLLEAVTAALSAERQVEELR